GVHESVAYESGGAFGVRGRHGVKFGPRIACGVVREHRAGRLVSGDVVPTHEVQHALVVNERLPREALAELRGGRGVPGHPRVSRGVVPAYLAFPVRPDVRAVRGDAAAPGEMVAASGAGGGEGGPRVGSGVVHLRAAGGE